MKILMLGWEFPPFFAGGVGIVCYELTKALSHIKDLEITYIMPYGPKDANKSNKTNHLNLLVANNNSFEQN
ncbi:MAG: glycogen/starch synthase, partial [bacterium]